MSKAWACECGEAHRVETVELAKDALIEHLETCHATAGAYGGPPSPTTMVTKTEGGGMKFQVWPMSCNWPNCNGQCQGCGVS